MLFSLFGEISLAVIGMLYVLDCWFDSFLEFVDMNKNDGNNDGEGDAKMSDSIKRMYS